MMPATTTVPSSKAKRKRVRDDDDTKNSSSRGKKSKNEQDESLLDLDAGINTAFAVMDSQLLADHIAQKTKRFGKDLSSVELSDLYVSANAIKDSTTFDKPRITDNLPAFLEHVVKDGGDELKGAAERNGAPHTIIVAGAGLRAANLVRAVRVFQSKGTTVAKLFAKHIKLEESVKFLETNRTGIAVGTPKRLEDLMDNGALSISHLRRIVIDASYIDQKKRGITDMPDTMMPLVRWLMRKDFRERYGDTERSLELLFF